MRYITKFIMSVFIITTIMNTHRVDSKIVEARTREELKTFLDQNNVMIALFYDQFLLARNSLLQAQIENAVTMFKNLSEIKQYEGAGLVFLLVDVSDHSFHLYVRELFQDYLPCYVLFVRGKPLRDSSGKIINMHGVVSVEQVFRFIAANLTKKLTTKVPYLAAGAYDFEGQPLEPSKTKQPKKRDIYFPESFWGTVWGPTFP